MDISLGTGLGVGLDVDVGIKAGVFIKAVYRH
jgi:hypothetical protein